MSTHNGTSRNLIGRWIIVLSILWVLVGACVEFHRVAWGTGNWSGEFSRAWAILFFVLVALCLLIFILVNLYLWRRESLAPILERIVLFRGRLGNACWLLSILVLLAPIMFLQYTAWGVVFQGLYLRLMLWAITAYLLAILFSKAGQLAGWRGFFSALIVTAGAFSIAASLRFVSDFPFSLGWSEGNRIWDYSILFGRGLYDYPAGRRIPVLLDFGRQLIGGLPFLLPNVTIWAERLWVGLTLILPYVLLGLAVFRMLVKDWKAWLVTTLWVFLFLKQGPIHPPLVLGAAMVALAWRAPLWYAIPLLAGAGLLVEASRYTWIFAPAIWIVMLEFASASFSDRRPAASIWRRSILLGLTGLIGALLLPRYINISAGVAQAFSPGEDAPVAAVTPMPVATATPQPSVSPTPSPLPPQETTRPSFIDSVINIVTIQPLLWYRLFPNSTYDRGILFALLLAVGPLLVVLGYLLIKRVWSPKGLQIPALVLPLLAFLGVGLVASTKIGGGGDLHNMDMFLIALMFTAVIAWQNGGREWLANIDASPQWIRLVIIIMFALPGLQPLREMRSYSFAEDLSWLRVLTDAPPKSTLDMLPPQEVTEEALDVIRAEVALAQADGGEVLFMDQRQLLTFGNIPGVPLVPEYEKKMLMNEALSANVAHFQPFYADLEARRFALIISDPLRTPIKDSSFQFGEENNAWVTWVSNPVLCYYEEKHLLKEVSVQLLVPKREPVDCSDQLP